MNYVKDLRKIVGTRPLILTGAVVLIINEHNELLLQLRSGGGWGLPGGLMELGESLEETASREVLEETGLIVGDLKLLSVFSGKEFYLKMAHGDELYSVTAVYMTRKYKGTMKRDNVETVDLQFFPLDQLPETLVHNYRKMIEESLGELSVSVK